MIGSVADDQVFCVVDMYFRGIWQKKRVLEELRFYRRNDQICILSQKLLDREVKFLKAYEVK